MNQKDVSEIRRRLNPDKNAIPAIRGCYVNEKREIVSAFNRPLISLPQEEMEKYLALLRRSLTGIPGKNLIEIEFRPDQVMDGEEHHLLSAMRNTQLKVEEGVQAFYQKVIDSLEMEGNYLLLLASDAYDVPFHPKDEMKVDDASEEVFNYFLCCVCPVKLTRPALSYFASDNDFHEREQDWVVAAPEIGFMFPAYEDGAANIYKALYFTRDTAELHDEFIDAVFNINAPMPAAEQKETFQSLLGESLGEDCSLEVVQAVEGQLTEMIEAHKERKEEEPLAVSKYAVKRVLEGCGVPEERLSTFTQRYDEAFGPDLDLSPRNLVNARALEVTTPDVTVKVNPERGDLVETRVIDGVRYILIRAEEGVQVNGIDIHIS